MSPVPADALLDLDPGIGQVASSVRFDLCTRDGVSLLGELNTATDASLSIKNNTTANIKRTLTGFEIDAEQSVDVDLFSARVCPKFVLESGREYPLGEFLFVTEDRLVSTGGRPITTTLYDQGFILAQPRSMPFGCDRGHNLITPMVMLAQEAGIDQSRMIVTYNEDKIVKDPISWPTGTLRSKILDDFAQLAGYFSPYFDNEGFLIIRPSLALDVDDSTLRYDQGGSIIADSYSIIPNLLQAPNVYLVINNGSQESEVAARFEIDPTAPNSISNRGFEIVEVVKTQGINSSSSAEDIGRAQANQSPKNFEQAQFDSPPDPRHDTFDTVLMEETDLYIEVDWSMELAPGGSMRHNLRKVVSSISS